MTSAQDRNGASQRGNLLKTLGAWSLVFGVLGSLSGCSVFLSGPTPERPERPVVVVPEEPASYQADASAEDNVSIFLQTLSEAATHEGEYTSLALAEYFVNAGFGLEQLQVSQDRTRTELEPESMFIAARFGDDCIIGQIVTADRTIVAEVMPAVGPDPQVCLIGLTATLEG